MAQYLLKFKGKYRILPELDLGTNDFPRDKNGEIAKEYDDIYIACQYGNRIYNYGKVFCMPTFRLLEEEGI